MTITSASEAITSLIEMAETGEIDPWDVQVIDVIDRFLDELGSADDGDAALARANLPRSGQAFLWASMLVLFKADTLERFSLDEGEEKLLEEEGFDFDGKSPPMPPFPEKHLRRRTSAPPPRGRRVTLTELIAQLQQIAVEIESLPPAPTVTAKPRPHSRREAREMIVALAHQENLTELAAELNLFLADKFVGFPSYHLAFDALQQLWGEEKKTVAPEKEKVALFWALLLLASQSKVELFQKNFYEDLTIGPVV